MKRVTIHCDVCNRDLTTQESSGLVSRLVLSVEETAKGWESFYPYGVDGHCKIIRRPYHFCDFKCSIDGITLIQNCQDYLDKRSKANDDSNKKA